MPQGSLQWVYYTDPSPGPTTVNLGQDTVRLGQGMAAGMESSGENGQTSTSSLEVDDPAATWDFTGLHSFYAVENAAPLGSHRLWTGILGKRTIRRGQGDSLRTQAARRWSINLIDHNEIVARRVINDTVEVGGNRPAETISARLTWLLGSAFVFAGMDQGHVQYPTNNLDKNDYRGQTPAEVLDNMSTVAGYMWFVKHNELSGTPELFFFDPDDVSFYLSTTSFSNVLADVTSVTDGSILAPEPSSYLDIDPGRVYSGVYLTYSGGSTYRSRAATATKFGGWRDTTVTRSDVKTLTMANAVADRYLTTLASEAERCYWDVRTPAANVNDVYEGMLTNLTMSHWPGYETPRPVRVVRRNVMAEEPTDELYMVHYEGIPITRSIVQQAFGSAQLVGGYAHPIFPNTPAVGDLLIAFVVASGNSVGVLPGEPTQNPALPAWTNLTAWQTAHDSYDYPGAGAGIGMAAYFRRVQLGDTTDCSQFTDPLVNVAVWVFELPYTADPTSVASLVLAGPPNASEYVHGASATIGAVTSGYVLGAMNWKMIDYAYGATVTPGTGTVTIASTDAQGDPLTTSTQYITAPWMWVGYNPSGTSIDIASWRSWWHDHGDAAAYDFTSAIGIAVQVPGL